MLITLAFVLTACSTSPTSNFYLLTANSEKSQSEYDVAYASHSSTEKNLIGIGPVTIPEFLYRSQIAYSMSGNNLVISHFDRWSEPVDKAIARVIGVNLTHLDPYRSSIQFPWRKASQPDFAVQVSITDLNRMTQDFAVLEADWSIIDAQTKKVLHRDRFSQTALISEYGPDFSYTALTRAYSDLLAILSERIDTELRVLQYPRKD
jgi:uncharacterized lipoprotein YmbA